MRRDRADLRQRVPDYEGADHCIALWPVIYAWDGSNYAYVSAQPRFRPFDQQEIKTLQQGTPNDCDEATIAKIQPFLGAPPKTGLDDAIAWAHSTVVLPARTRHRRPIRHRHTRSEEVSAHAH